MESQDMYYPEAWFKPHFKQLYAQKFAGTISVALAFFILQSIVRYFMISQSFRNYLQENTPLDQKGANKISVLATSRVVGFVHNAIQLTLAVQVLQDSTMWENQVHKTTQLSNVAMLISAGFFLFDSVHCLQSIKQEGPLYAIHAVSCFTVYYYAYNYNIIHFFGAVYLMWESSTPFIHLRWYLYKTGFKNSRLYGIVSTLAVLIFFLCRIVWGYYATYLAMQATKTELEVKIEGYSMSVQIVYIMRFINIGLDLLNTYWFSLMMKKIVLVIGGKSFANVTGEKDE